MEVDLELLRDIVYEKASFTVSGVSDVLQLARVRGRIKALGYGRFEEYVSCLRADNNGELQQLVNLLTVNETYFFRDYDQLVYFAEEVLPFVTAAKAARSEHKLRVLCGACSSGEEAYTVAIVLLEMLADEGSWTVEIDAVDIDTDVLARARKGRYRGRTVRDVPHAYKTKYFKVVDDSYEVTNELRRVIRFSHVNMVSGEQMRAFRGFDIVFCRNLLIYLDTNQRERLVHELYHGLRPGGVLFIAPSETIGQFSTVFALEKIGSRYVYRKPGERGK